MSLTSTVNKVATDELGIPLVNTIIEFEKELKNKLYDRQWCEFYGIDYINPDVTKARGCLHQEKYGKNTSDSTQSV
jgi:hypothetical protein